MNEKRPIFLSARAAVADEYRTFTFKFNSENRDFMCDCLLTVGDAREIVCDVFALKKRPSLRLDGYDLSDDECFLFDVVREEAKIEVVAEGRAGTNIPVTSAGLDGGASGERRIAVTVPGEKSTEVVAAAIGEAKQKRRLL